MTVYKYGMSGAGVRTLQKDLNKLGFNLAVDGKFGPATKYAVSDFQTDNGLLEDGVAGPATQRMIARRINEKIGEKVTVIISKIAEMPEYKELEAFLYD